MNSPELTLRTQLKSATQALHLHLEELPCQRLLLSESCRAQDYRRVLTGYAEAIASVDDLLKHSQWPMTCPYVPRLPLLQQDLQQLGCDWVPSALPSLPEHLNPWGLRYVLEGMALGGQVILRRASVFTCPETALATQFLSCRPLHWPDFCAALELDAATSQATAVTSACWMFERFIEALTDRGVSELHSEFRVAAF